MSFPIGRSVKPKPGKFIDESGFIQSNRVYSIVAVDGRRIQLLGYPNPNQWFDADWFEWAE